MNCFYVGDTLSDVLHAKGAGVKAVAYLGGHFPEDAVLGAGPDFAIRDLKEILDLLNQV